MEELDDATPPDAGGDRQAPTSSPLTDRAAVEIWKPKFTLDQRLKILRRLLLGMNMFDEDDEEQQEEDLLGIDAVMDRWVQVLLENLPPCPWTGIRTTIDRTDARFVVDVVRINYEELTADAVVIGEINAKGQVSGWAETPRGDAPCKQVPLEELLVFPTSDNVLLDNLDKHNTVLDCLSFFKNHLWFSWDEEEAETEDEETMDVVRKNHDEKAMAFRYFEKKFEAKKCCCGPDRWLELHLDNRFAVYADHVNRRNSVYFRLRKLSVDHEAQKTGLKWNEHEVMVGGGGGGGLPESLLDCWKAKERLERIERRAVILENPDLRAASVNDKRRERDDESRIALVWSSGNVDDFFELQKVAAGSFRVVVVEPTLQQALDSCLRGDTIVIPRGTHGVLDWGEFRFGGRLLGLDVHECIVETECVDGVKPFSLVVEGGCAFANLTVMPAVAKRSHGILVRRQGYVRMESCQLNQFDVACKVTADASLSVDRCSFGMGGVGLMVEKGGNVTAVNFDVLLHDRPFVFKDATGCGLDFTRVGSDYAEAHTVIVVDDDDDDVADNVLRSARIEQSPELVKEGISIVTEFPEEDF